MRQLTIALALSLGLVACGSYPSPTERMASSQAALRVAQEVNAASNPQAALHLKLAQEQLEQAKQMMAENNNRRAEYVLMRAEVDAELAEALAREAQLKAQAAQAVEDVKNAKSRVGGGK
ncbi:MAG: DUF4398 domain-containing protein [Polyangiaceae bacterium]